MATRVVHLAVLALMIFLVSGCELVWRSLAVNQGTPAPTTSFAHGTATITITTGEPVVVRLDRIGNTTFFATYDPNPPANAQAEWMDSSGYWLLTVLANTAPNPAFSGQQGILWIQNGGSEPPLYADGSPCRIAITEVSAAGLVGTADCQSLRWLNDYEAQTLGPENASPLPDAPPFDAVITFEARP